MFERVGTQAEKNGSYTLDNKSRFQARAMRAASIIREESGKVYNPERVSDNWQSDCDSDGDIKKPD